MSLLVRLSPFINIFVPDAARVRGLRLIEGGAYSSKYGIAIGFKESKCLQLLNSLCKEKN